MDKKLFKYILLIITFAILLVFALWNINSLFALISKILMILRPVIIGFVIAFILNQPFNFLKSFFKKLFKKSKTDKLPNFLATVFVYALLILFITAIIIIIIPQFIKSISLFKANLDTYSDNFMQLSNKIFEMINANIPTSIDIFDKLSGYIETIPSLAGKVRITSYNVCYTKLLREFN